MTATLLTGPKQRALVTGGDPDKPFPVPQEDDFLPEDADLVGGDPDCDDFSRAPELLRIGDALIARHETLFKPLRGLHVAYLWKRAGGTTAGKATLGRCVKASGLARHFSKADAIVWLAADHCRAARLSAYQVEALLFRELLRLHVDEDGKVRVVGYDFAGFNREIVEYGLWQRELVDAGRAIQQLQLPLFGANGHEAEGGTGLTP